MADGQPDAEDNGDFEALLEDLRDRRGFDFTGYKRASLRRRILRRMGEVGIEEYLVYADHLQVHPEEFVQLFNTILINVTAFFRDPEHWQYLDEEVLPRISKGLEGEQIRVWSAGCSSGEEPYTLAMLLARHLGAEAFEERVKIYATDVDNDALATARRAVYDAEAIESVPSELRAECFEPARDRFAVRPHLRRAVIFGRHDLVKDAPISHLDLLVCRNVLMYLNSDTQAGVLRNLHFALNKDGFLFLGKAEMLLTRTDLFEPVELSHRVFRRAAGSSIVPRAPQPLAGKGRNTHVSRNVRLRDAAFSAVPVSQVVVDLDGLLVLANKQACSTFGLGPQDIGRPLQDLEVAYRPVELRGPIDVVRRERRAQQLRNVERQVREGQSQHFDVLLAPLLDSDDQLIGVGITFDDVTAPEELRGRLQQTNHDLETAYEEIQSANEELETTNEELQSTVEELETTNEELQSSNEELETMNEELQSANAEQEEINHELMIRTEEIEELNAYLRSIMRSLQVGVAVLGPDFEVRIWNDEASEQWGLWEEEVVGRSLLSLDMGLDVGQLADPIRSCLRTGDPTQVVIPAVNRRGRKIDCRVQLAPLVDRAGERKGVVVLMESSASKDLAER